MSAVEFPPTHVLVNGHNYWGQLGLERDDVGNTTTIETLTRVPLPAGVSVVDVAAGDYHSVLLTSQGEVYTFGCGRSGQLGHGTRDSLSTPTKVARLDGVHIVKIAAGAQSTLAVSASGRVYMMGTLGRYTYGGELPRVCVAEPTLVQGLATVEVVDVACGGWHVVALDAGGKVYTWGWNKACQLGHGDAKSRTQPRLVKVLRNHRVVQVAAGRQHSMVLLEEGFVVGWGSNRYGVLGGASSGYVRKPQLIELSVTMEEGYTFLPSSIHAGPYSSFVSGLASLKRGSIKPRHRPRGIVFATGLGTDGELGSGRIQTQRMFTRFKLGWRATPARPITHPEAYEDALPDAGPVALGSADALLARRENLQAALAGKNGSDDDVEDGYSSDDENSDTGYDLVAVPSAFDSEIDSDNDSDDVDVSAFVGGGAGTFNSVCVPLSHVLEHNRILTLHGAEGERAPAGSVFPVVAPGRYHTFAVKRGALWATGWAFGGRLGFSIASLTNCDTATSDVPQRLPARVPLPPNSYALSASCGSGHSLVLVAVDEGYETTEDE